MSRSSLPWQCPNWVLLAVLVLLSLGLVEFLARTLVGLGDPVLMQTDPDIEYLAVPSKTYHRFGKTISYNQWSMRSDELPLHKALPTDLRILLVGDSVINGGTLTDQADLASEILKHTLSGELHTPVSVGNISAGGWGPPNELAYLQRYGLFDTDAIVLVVSSSDYADVPGPNPVGIDSNFPDHPPLLAIQEAWVRYLPRLVPAIPSSSEEQQLTKPAPNREAVAWSLNSVAAISDLARQHRVPLIAALHAERTELESGFHEGHYVLLQKLTDLGVAVVELAPQFESALEQGQTPYRDYIHPNSLGQHLIADDLYEPLLTVLKSTQTLR